MVLEMAQAFVEIFGTFGSSTLGDCKIISTWRNFGIFSFSHEMLIFSSWKISMKHEPNNESSFLFGFLIFWENLWLF
jgi:hypothetical protein